MSPWLWTESRANVRLTTLDSLLPTLTPGINGRQFGVHGHNHHCPRLTRSRIQPRSNFREDDCLIRSLWSRRQPVGFLLGYRLVVNLHSVARYLVHRSHCVMGKSLPHLRSRCHWPAPEPAARVSKRYAGRHTSNMNRRRRRLCKRSRFTASLLDPTVTRRRSSFRERESSTLSLMSAKSTTLWMK
jgi:hypothetical protein